MSLFIKGSFEQLKRDNPSASHRLYGRIMALIELSNARKGKSVKWDSEYIPDYNDEFFPEDDLVPQTE